ncbi:MAG: mannose-ethanolamine phosphotransferase gpi13 [Trichoglossum hirsutum]|nr:MAG: mannose-ethanolamine phosphotransferase gpi13 [Trichoglossum hirsutum]
MDIDPKRNYRELAAKAKAVKEPSGDSKELTEQVQHKNELQFKASHGLLVGFLLWICFLHASGIYFFTKGFLLTRLVLDHKSRCNAPPIELPNDYDYGSPSNGCWHPKTFDKAVIIIVDALRYDFTVPFSGTNTEAPQHFHNALSVLYESASQRPGNALLLPFIADPPTATLQRLKGLTTGTLPTFVDLGSNFAGTAIEEDNLVAQLRDAGKNIVQLGDDTWTSLFPGYFDPNLTKAYESFNVWDLHTVDNGVTEHLFPLLHPSNSSKWDVIIGHYLGVDHAGHRYGPDHPAMAAKLQQMDGVIRQLVGSVDESTVLVVLGDHGMDAKGDHGGESDDEIQAALWMFSKKEVFGRTSQTYQLPPQTAKERPVRQIDLVPTLALLLGIPIPFNNLGAPIEEAFIGLSGDNWQNLALASHLTGAQIKRYQRKYALARGLVPEVTSTPQALWGMAKEKWANAARYSDDPSAPIWKSAFERFSSYQKETLDICRSLWASFDLVGMVEGLLILLGGIVVVVCYSKGLGGDVIELTPLLFGRTLMGIASGAAVGGTLKTTYLVSSPLLEACLLGSAIGGLFGFASAALAARRRIASPLPNNLWGWLAVIFTVSQSAGFASNSYTIWEDTILLFLLSSFGVVAIVSSLRQQEFANKVLGTYQSAIFIFLTRLASFSRLCREEQMPFCRSTYYASATSSTSAPWQLLIPFAIAILLPGIIKSYYEGTRSYGGSSVFWIGFAFRVGLFLSAIYWSLDAADDGDWLPINKDILKASRIYIAQFVLATALAAGSTTFVWAKPCLNIVTTREVQQKENEDTKTIPSGTGQPLIILGYANVHGSRYFLLVVNFLLAIILLQKPMGGGAIGVLAWQILCLLEIIDCNSLSDSAIGPVVLGLLGGFHFFKTGHQATLSAIQWESAFIPMRSVRYPWSPLLIVGNTFGAQILTALAVPLVALWKQPPEKKGLLSAVAIAATTHMLYHAVISISTTLWAYWLRRHLMLYRIFSPRFMTAAATLLVIDLVIAILAVGGIRWNMLSVAEVFGYFV